MIERRVIERGAAPMAGLVAGLGMRRYRSLAWEVRPPPPPPYFFQNVVIPLSLPFRVGKRCDSKGVEYKNGKPGYEWRMGRAYGIGSSGGSAKSGCIGRMRSFANLYIYIFYRASKEGLVEKVCESGRASRNCPAARCSLRNDMVPNSRTSEARRGVRTLFGQIPVGFLFEIAVKHFLQ